MGTLPRTRAWEGRVRGALHPPGVAGRCTTRAAVAGAVMTHARRTSLARPLCGLVGGARAPPLWAGGGEARHAAASDGCPPPVCAGGGLWAAACPCAAPPSLATPPPGPRSAAGLSGTPGGLRQPVWARPPGVPARPTKTVMGRPPRSGADRVCTCKRVFLVKSSDTPSVRPSARTSLCGRTVEELREGARVGGISYISLGDPQVGAEKIPSCQERHGANRRDG